MLPQTGATTSTDHGPTETLDPRGSAAGVDVVSSSRRLFPHTSPSRLTMIKFTFGIIEQLVCSAIYVCAFLGVILFTLSVLT